MQGIAAISLEIIPKSMADETPNGQGRDEPNAFPVLPEPTGRFSFVTIRNNEWYIGHIFSIEDDERIFRSRIDKENLLLLVLLNLLCHYFILGILLWWRLNCHFNYQMNLLFLNS